MIRQSQIDYLKLLDGLEPHISVNQEIQQEINKNVLKATVNKLATGKVRYA